MATAHPLTEVGIVVGTIGYMSPEQVRGLPADSRSDIFSFGTVLFEMLVGHRPFRGETTADTLSAILREDPPALTETSVPLPLERIVRRCLEKAPPNRFQSADDLAFALEAVTLTSAAPATTTVDVPRERVRWLLPVITTALALWPSHSWPSGSRSHRATIPARTGSSHLRRGQGRRTTPCGRRMVAASPTPWR